MFNKRIKGSEGMKVKLDDLVVDANIYPRNGINWHKVGEYVEAIQSEEEFPPLVVEKNSKKILDGIHRYHAYKKTGIEETEVEFREVEEKRFMLTAGMLNSRHGIPLSYSEKQYVAVETAKLDDSVTQQELANSLGVSQKTISNWIKEIRARQEEERKYLIYRLSLLSWNGNEIGNVVGLSKRQSNEILSSGFSNFTKTALSLLKQGFSPSTIAERLQVSEESLVWAVALEGKSDEERMKEFQVAPEIYNVWNFSVRDKRLGHENPAHIAGQIPLNAIYFYTKKGDLVVDPMAGGGCTIDACLVLGRKCRAYDIEPNRKEIVKHDIRNGYPDKAKNCDLIFLDPPYFNMVFDIFEDISEFYEFIEQLAKHSLETVKKKGYVTVLMQDMTEKGNYCLSGETYRIFKDVGFSYVSHISCPLSSQQFNAQQVEKAKKTKHLLGTNRDMYVFRK